MQHVGPHLACLALALLLTGMLAYMLSPAVVERHTESFSGGEVTVSYVYGPNPLTNNLPVIQVTDTSGNNIDALVINVFAVMPYANIKYLGAVGVNGGTVIIPRNIISKLSSEAIPTWRKELKHLGGFEPSLLLFIDIIRKLSNGTYATYPQVKAVPLNLQLLSIGYKLNSITIEVNTSTVKPSIIAPNTVTLHTKLIQLNTSNQGCVILHNGFKSLTYCVKWRLQKEYAHLKNTLIPIIALRIPNGYYTDPQAVFYTYLSFNFQESTSAYFKLYAGIKLSSMLQIHYDSVEKFTDFSFVYDKDFFNSRWTPEEPSFTDDVVIVVGFKGSATLGLFREYDASCSNNEPWCPEDDYVPTSTTANITLMDINVMYDGEHWVATAYGYGIDDVVGDGSGWDKYWSLAKEHAQPEGTSAGVGEATYRYLANANKENYIGIDIADLVTMITGNHKLSPYFPIDAGIGFGSKDTSTQTINVHIRNENQYLDYYVYIDSYVSRDEVYVNGVYTHLKLMLFDVEDYSPW